MAVAATPLKPAVKTGSRNASGKVTIKSIAEMANVHPATVDKVLHHREGVSAEVRHRVQALIDEYHYTPNPAGRVLQKQGKKYNLAAILVDVDSLEGLRAGIRNGISEQIGFDIVVKDYVTGFQEAASQADIIDKAIKDKVDGIILTPIHSDLVRKAIDRAVDSGIPVVTTNSDIDRTKRFCYVGHDGERVSRIAGRLMGLLLGGKGRIAIIASAIASENNNYYVKIREDGFRKFVKEHYPNIETVAIVENFENAKITYDETQKLLKENADLNGIYITCGGVREVGRAVFEAGRSKDVSVLSFECYPEILEMMRREVIDCTIDTDIEKQGRLPVSLIMDYLVFNKLPEKEQCFIDTKIVVKESVL